MKKRVIFAAFAAAAVTTACREPLDIGSFSVSGRWLGTTVVHSATDSAAFTLGLTLSQDQRSITGTGYVRSDADSIPVKVSGEWNYPAVTLRLSSPTYAGILFGGQFTPQGDRNTLAGPLQGSGFDVSTFTFQRQP